MLYYITKLVIRTGLEFFFRKRYVQGLKELNTGKPLLVCSNHASTFLDAMIIMVLSKRKFHVLVRSDVFKRSWANFLLRRLNLIPIYRIRDGFDQLEKNNKTFEECINVFRNNGAIIIFPEANCLLERKLRKLHKGAAKIAFAAEEKYFFQLGLEVATVGINYERMTRFGGYLHLQCSKPFAIAPYRDQYQQDKSKTLSEVTGRIERDLRAGMAVIERKEDEFLFERALEYDREISKDFPRLKTFSERVNQADEELKGVLTQAITDFEQNLDRRGIRLSTLNEFATHSLQKQRLIMLRRGIDAIVLLPFFVIGYLFHGIMFKLPYKAAHHFFKKEKEYISSVNLAGSAILGYLTYIACFIVFYAFLNSLIGTLILLGIVFICGLTAYRYFREVRKLRSAIQFLRLNREQKMELLEHYQLLKQEISAI